MKPIIETNDIIQMMMSRQTTIKPFSGKAKDCHKWELKQRNMCVMANLGYVLEDSFTGKLSSSEAM